MHYALIRSYLVPLWYPMQRTPVTKRNVPIHSVNYIYPVLFPGLQVIYDFDIFSRVGGHNRAISGHIIFSL